MTYEYPLVLFTVFGQLAAGVALLICLTCLHKHPESERRAWLVVLVAGIIAVVSAAFHLHALTPAFFSINGIGSSWLSREILVGIVFGILVLLRLFNIIKGKANWLIGILAVCFVLAMSQIYSQNGVVPLWHTWGTVISFLATMLLLGGAGILTFAPETNERPCLAVSAMVVGGLFALALPAFWLGGMLAPLDPMLLGVFATAAICVTLTQTACYAAGGILMACGIPGKSTLTSIGFALMVIGAFVGRMLFYAANIRLGV